MEIMINRQLLRTSWTFFLAASCISTKVGIANGNSPFPNPVTEPVRCNRSRPSFICNPDGVLSQGEADRLDHLAFNLRRSTICVCAKCDSRHLGASFGVYIEHNNSTRSMDPTSIARQLRQNWKFGTCEDDIVVVVLAETKEAAFDMGPAIQNIITKELGEKIFNECAVHFENSNFYQGLESMVNSYHDILRRFQRVKHKVNRSNLSMILGISLGVIALLVFISAMLIVIKYKAINRRYKRELQRSMPYQESIIKKQHFEYHVCNADEFQFKKTRNGSSTAASDDDDEDKESDEGDVTIYEPMKLSVPLTRTKRQLSDVAEENEEESEGSLRNASARSGKVLTTEL